MLVMVTPHDHVLIIGNRRICIMNRVLSREQIDSSSTLTSKAKNDDCCLPKCQDANFVLISSTLHEVNTTISDQRLV